MDFSISDAIRQNTPGQSEGFPAGVPKSFSWYQGSNGGGLKIPPEGFTALEGWGQVYQQVGAPAYSNPDATVEAANAKTYVRVKQTGQWVLVQDQSKTQLTGGHFVSDFAGNAAQPMKATPLEDGKISFGVPPAGHNDHFWYKMRGTYAAGTVDAVYVQMDFRVTDPNVHLVAMVGADWWRDVKAPYLHDHSNNPGIGGSNWIKLSTEWSTIGFYSSSTAQFEANPPPPLLEPTMQARQTTASPLSDHGAAGNATDKAADEMLPAPSGNAPTGGTAPVPPKLTSFSPASGTAGDGFTRIERLTLNGTAEAGATVKIFDGTAQIGTATADASGAWSFTTAQLSNAAHSFTATATDSGGNTSSMSSLLNVQMEPEASPPPSAVPTPTPNAESPLIKGSLNVTPIRACERTGVSGHEGSQRTGQVIMGQSCILSIDTHLRSGLTGSTPLIEASWNHGFLLLTLILGAIITSRRNNSLDQLRRGASSGNPRRWNNLPEQGVCPMGRMPKE